MTSLVFPSSIITEFYNGSVWVNISRYVVSDITGDSGFPMSDPDMFTASLGTSEFDLNNSGGLFTPYGGDSVRGLNTLAGWGKNTKIRHRVVYGGFDKEFWTGFVSNIASDDGTWGDQRVHVTCLDWIDVAARYPMKRSQILTDKTLADGVQSIVDRISVPPEGVKPDPSTTIFPAIFDNVKSKTKALSEIDKLARSETGRVYVLKDGVLRVEASDTRKGTSLLTKVPVVGGNALLVSANNALLVSADNAYLVSEIEDANLALTSEKLDLQMRDEFWNDAFVRNYPTFTDTSLKVLYNLGTPIPISPGRTIEWIGNYSDPNGGNPVNGTNMQTPVATTDYLFNTKEDGSGTNVTASGSVSAEYFGDVVVYRLLSSYPSPAWVTKLQARGFGIYRTSYSESHISITGSVNSRGEKTFDLNQTYQSLPYDGIVYGKSVLEIYKEPKTRINSARYCANLNSSHMLAGMYLDVGSLIKVYDGRSAMNKWYHIASRKFKIFLGGIIILTFVLIEHLSVASGGLNPVAVEFHTGTSAGDPGATVDFGVLPHVYSDENPASKQISFSVWANLSLGGNLILLSTNNGGFRFSVSHVALSDTYLSAYSNVFNVAPGNWNSVTIPSIANNWHLLSVTYDFSSPNNDPVFYVDGVPYATIETITPAGAEFSREGTPVMIGAVKTLTENYLYPPTGKLFDARIYHGILSASEFLAIYNGGTPSMFAGKKDGLVFQAFAINSDLGDASSLDGQQIPDGNNYFDNIMRYVGEPVAAPIIRSTP